MCRSFVVSLCQGCISGTVLVCLLEGPFFDVKYVHFLLCHVCCVSSMCCVYCLHIIFRLVVGFIDHLQIENMYNKQ
jgi:hypothetical protein